MRETERFSPVFPDALGSVPECLCDSFNGGGVESARRAAHGAKRVGQGDRPVHIALHVEDNAGEVAFGYGGHHQFTRQSQPTAESTTAALVDGCRSPGPWKRPPAFAT
jgi:hypothetical protein